LKAPRRKKTVDLHVKQSNINKPMKS